jgi:hypothetical protein
LKSAFLIGNNALVDAHLELLRNRADNLLAEFAKVYDATTMDTALVDKISQAMSQLASDERFIYGSISETSYNLAVKADQLFYSLESGKIVTDLTLVDDVFRSDFLNKTKDLSPLINPDEILRIPDEPLIEFGSPRSDTTVKAGK